MYHGLRDIAARAQGHTLAFEQGKAAAPIPQQWTGPTGIMRALGRHRVGKDPRPMAGNGQPESTAAVRSSVEGQHRIAARALVDQKLLSNMQRLAPKFFSARSSPASQHSGDGGLPGKKIALDLQLSDLAVQVVDHLCASSTAGAFLPRANSSAARFTSSCFQLLIIADQPQTPLTAPPASSPRKAPPSPRPALNAALGCFLFTLTPLWTGIGRLGTPNDFAKGIVFLASDDASFMTGAGLVIDGGLTAL
jgi:hypothetical protein